MKRGAKSGKDVLSSNMENIDKKSSGKQNGKDETLRKHVPDSVVIHDAIYCEEDVPSGPAVAIKSPVPKDNLYYNMSLQHRGNCVVFNHKLFSADIGENREGTLVDATSIYATFSQLGFHVKIHDDLSFSDIDTVMTDLIKTDYTDHCCLCIFVLTHGNSHGTLYSNNLSYPLEYLWKPFTADKCKTLSGKPKLFFIQACRGSNVDTGVPMCSRTIMPTNTSSSYKLPVQADFLIAHSTVEDHVSWRDPSEGSWYIQTLCDVINKHWETTDLLKMLTITSRIVATSYVSQNDDSSKNEMVQIPTFTSTLTRDLLFTPKDA